MTSVRIFPEVYAKNDRPPRRGASDKARGFRTPSYSYGWVVSSSELFEALYQEECTFQQWLDVITKGVKGRFFNKWMESGLRDSEYSPSIPVARNVGPDHVLIYMACNDTEEVMDHIMADKKYHQECRDCLGNPKTMELQPAWFRVGIKGIPKGFIPDGHDGKPEVSHS